MGGRPLVMRGRKTPSVITPGKIDRFIPTRLDAQHTFDAARLLQQLTDGGIVCSFVCAGSGGSCGRGNSSTARDAGCPLRTGADTALFRWRTRLLQSVLRKASGERIKGPKFSGCLACVKMNSTAPASSALQLPCPAAIEPTVSDQLCNSAAPSALRRGISNVFSARSEIFGDALEALVQGKGGHPPWLVQQSMFVLRVSLSTVHEHTMHLCMYECRPKSR